MQPMAPRFSASASCPASTMLYTGIRQGEVLASAIHASKAKPEIFGISLAPAAVLEGFSVFALVFALVLSGSIPA